MRLSSLFALALLLVLPVGAQAQVNEPFGVSVRDLKPGEIEAMVFMRRHLWFRVQKQIEEEQAVLDACEKDPASCSWAAARFLDLVGVAKNTSGLARLSAVSDSVAQYVRYYSDLGQWGPTEPNGLSEKWSPPLETYATGYGDCEDYAIVMWAAFKRAGISLAAMRLLVVDVIPKEDEKKNPDEKKDRERHVVLAVFQDSTWYLLDPVTGIPLRTAHAASKVYEPRYAVSENKIRAYVLPDSVSTVAAR